MTSLTRALLVVAVHLALVLALVGRYAWDRATYPRAWFRALPYDPNLPIRGRYVSLRLIGVPAANETGRPVAFFIPEHIADPSVRAPGEELWVEATLPPTGAPRPIRLAVKKNGVMSPL
jgi:hypothetical protein